MASSLTTGHLYFKWFVSHTPLLMAKVIASIRRTKLPWFLVLLISASLPTGCATPQQKIDKRKQEKYSAYAALPPDQKTAVDKGQINSGMPMDAVYIAWGKPSQVVTSGSQAGTFVTWVYLNVYLQSYFVGGGWGYGPFCYGPYFAGPYIDYYPVNYVSAEVVFHDGVVQSWRTLPRPGY
jgi:hypothetical protein